MLSVDWGLTACGVQEGCAGARPPFGRYRAGRKSAQEVLRGGTLGFSVLKKPDVQSAAWKGHSSPGCLQRAHLFLQQLGVALTGALWAQLAVQAMGALGEASHCPRAGCTPAVWGSARHADCLIIKG